MWNVNPLTFLRSLKLCPCFLVSGVPVSGPTSPVREGETREREKERLEGCWLMQCHCRMIKFILSMENFFFLKSNAIILFYFIFIWRIASKWVCKLFLIRQHVEVPWKARGPSSMQVQLWNTNTICSAGSGGLPACLSVPTARQKELLGNWWKRNCSDFRERERNVWIHVRIGDLLTLLWQPQIPSFGEPGAHIHLVLPH